VTAAAPANVARADFERLGNIGGLSFGLRGIEGYGVGRRQW
jgi:hypothetical protein